MDNNVQMQENKRKNRTLERSLLSALVLLVVTIGVFTAQTYAYFVDSTTSGSNQVITGHLDVELLAIHDEDGGQTERPTIPTKIMPGTSAKQGDVVVKNAGSIPIYARVQIEKRILHSENEISADLDSLIFCNFMADGSWTFSDGYYYYTTELAPGDLTTALFDTVIFSPNMGNEFKNSTLQFKVICQSVQSSNNSDDPLTAFGWPSSSVAE